MKYIALLLIAAAVGCAVTPPPYTPPTVPASGARLADLAPETTAIDLSRPLTPEQLAAIAVLGNPDLKALRTRAGVAEAQVFAAGLLPDPSFSLGVDFPLNGAHEVVALATSLGLDLASLRTRPARIEAARKRVAQTHQEILWAEWQTREGALLLALRISWLEQILARTAEYRKLAEEDLARVIRAAGRGDISAAQVDARRLSAADAADRNRSAENELAAARLDLNRLLGLDPFESLALAQPTPPAPIASQFDELFRTAVERRADLAAMEEGLQAANDDVAVLQASRFPLPSVSLNAGRDTGDIRTLGPAVTFTLPIWNRGRGDLAGARADFRSLESEYLARAQTVRADLAAALSAYRIANRQQAEVAGDLEGILPQAQASREAADRGDLAETIAAANRMAVLDKLILSDRLSLAAAESAVAVEASVGAPLDQIR